MPAPEPGSPEYLKQVPLQQRLIDAKNMQGMLGGNIPQLAFLTPDELRYFRALAVPDEAWAQDAKKRFPDQAQYLDIPEIAAILRQAVDGWTPDQVASALTQTNWWLTHTPEQRQWFILNNTDPASAMRSLQTQMQEIMVEASKFGVRLTTGNAMTLATLALSQGWTQQDLVDGILNYEKGGFNHGTLGATKDQLRGLTTDFMVGMSESGLDKWTRMIASGRSDLGTFKNEMAEKAKSMFQDKSLWDALDRGMTVRQFADPYLQTAAELLGLNPDDIDLKDAKWRESIDFFDPASKQRRAQTLSEWTANVKTNAKYGYDFSQHGINESAGLATSIRERFGVK